MQVHSTLAGNKGQTWVLRRALVLSSCLLVVVCQLGGVGAALCAAALLLARLGGRRSLLLGLLRCSASMQHCTCSNVQTVQELSTALHAFFNKHMYQ